MFSKGFLFLVLVASHADALRLLQEKLGHDGRPSKDGKVVFKELNAILDRDSAHNIERLTSPTAPLQKCGGKLDVEGLVGHGGGDYYGWCPNAMRKVLTEQKGHVKGLSYGIFTFDSWSKKMANKYNVPTELYDCYTKKERATEHWGKQYKVPYNYHETCLGTKKETKKGGTDEGRQFETLDMHLKDRKPLSTFMKMDIEGSEWEVLPKLLDSPKDLEKIASIDFEFHFCEVDKLGTMQMLEKLADNFVVTGRHPSAKGSNIRGYCQKMAGATKKAPCMSVSYVNKRLLEQLKDNEQFPADDVVPAVEDVAWRKQ